MPQIQTYESSVVAQGQINSQATSDAFGGQIGRATQELGGSLAGLGQQIQQVNETEDVTNVHVNMAKARADWTKTLQDRSNAAQPGDETFAPTMMKDMGDFFAKGADSATTPKGKQLWATMAANMQSEFGQRAIGGQSELAGKDAVNKYDLLVKSVGSAVYNDQSQIGPAMASGKAAIDDPTGIFSKVPQTVRDKLKDQLEQDVNFAAAKGYVRNNPEGILKAIDPSQLEQFKPWENIVKSNAAPGAKVNVSKQAMQWAPQVTAAAAVKGLNPAILIAQIDAESGGRADAVNKADALKTGSASIGLAQFQPATAKQYGIDPSDPAQAIKGQAAYMADLVKQFGGDYTKALAAYNWGPGNLTSTLQRFGSDWQSHIPKSTSEYVGSIMSKSGQMPSSSQPDVLPADPTAANVQRSPVASSLPFVQGLTWEQQDGIVKEAVQLQHMRVTMAEKAREEQKYLLGKQRDVVMDGMLKRVIDPTANGVLKDDDILNDQTLSWQEKQHMLDYKISRNREVLNAAEAKTNPTEVRSLMLQIHAADDDPTKSYNMDPVMAAYRSGSISTQEMRMLRGEVEQLRDGNSNSFIKQMHSAREVVYTSLSRSIMGQMMPEVAADASYRFNVDLENQVAALRKENKNPRTLLDPTSKDYVLKPERIQAYLQNSQATMQGAAAKITEAKKSAIQPGTVLQGYRFKGGDAADKSNWELVK